MNRRLKDVVIEILDGHRLMSLSTNRPDGWPQTTLVGYVNDGYLLYCFVARNSQKFANIQRDSRVSIAIGSDVRDPHQIKGLSLSGRASVVTDPAEYEYVSRLRLKRYPEYAALSAGTSDAAQRMAPQPVSDKVVLLRIAPEIISVVDYSKGLGHSDLITFSERDLDHHIESLRHHWMDDRPSVAASPGPGTSDASSTNQDR